MAQMRSPLKGKSIYDWTNEDVASWADTIGLSSKWCEQLKSAIADSGINGQDLLEMDPEDPDDVRDCFAIGDCPRSTYRIIFKAIRTITQQETEKQNKMALGGIGSQHDTEISVGINSGQRVCNLKVRPEAKVQELFELYRERELGTRGQVTLRFHGKRLSPNATLKECGISKDGCMVVASLRVWGGGPPAASEEYHAEWTVMYSNCPVCRQTNGNSQSVRGYWYHPGGNKAEFRQEKPGTSYIVECKESKIRCANCKNESEAKDWIFKCPNHDYKKI